MVGVSEQEHAPQNAPGASGSAGLGPNPMVRFRGIKKSFGEVVVLAGVDLDIAPAERVALIGPSGAGKTTLLRMVMTLEEPDAGTIEIEGEQLWHQMSKGKLVRADQHHLRKVRGKIGMVFQQFNLFPHMDVLHNVTLAPMQVLGMRQEQAEEKARNLLDMVGLAAKAGNYPAQLSGGQQQRVAVARALALQPKVMLFDEITGALDPELVGEVLNVVRDLAQETEMTMLLVTHEMDFARDVANRVIFLDGGCIVEEGSPQVIFSCPENPRTREFLKRVLDR
jgi:polar amino acid transport system ATP-binding protein